MEFKIFSLHTPIAHSFCFLNKVKKRSGLTLKNDKKKNLKIVVCKKKMKMVRNIFTKLLFTKHNCKI